MHLAQKVERSLALYLDSVAAVAELGYNTSVGVDSDPLTLDAIICHAAGASEDPLGSGNYMVSAVVEVRTSPHAQDPDLPNENRAAVHAAAVGAVEDALSDDDLAASLSSQVAEFYVFPPVIDRQHDDRKVEDRGYSSLHSMRLYCCSLDLV